MQTNLINIREGYKNIDIYSPSEAVESDDIVDEEFLIYYNETANDLYNNTQYAILGNFRGTDFGDAAQIPGPGLFRKFYKPCYKMINDWVHKNTKREMFPFIRQWPKWGIFMNLYVSVINEIIEHIECNIGESLQLTNLSTRAGVSDFHFNRMFKTVAGITLKQYVLGRKLTKALEQLRDTDKSVMEIAMDFGFDYPEVFSRAFKKQFGLSPSDIRHKKIRMNGIKKAAIVERDIINYRGTLALKGNSVFLEAMKLVGINVKADTNSGMFKQKLKAETEAFILESAKCEGFKSEKFYTIVSCGGNENGQYNVFCGRQPEKDAGMIHFDEYIIPGGWYVDFIYLGDMFDIREVFIDDLYKWIMVKEAEINPNGIGMLNIYENNYPENRMVHILVPIKKPV